MSVALFQLSRGNGDDEHDGYRRSRGQQPGWCHSCHYATPFDGAPCRRTRRGGDCGETGKRQKTRRFDGVVVSVCLSRVV